MSTTPNDPIYQRILSTLPQKKDAIIKSIPEHTPQALTRALNLMIKRGEVITISDDLYIAARAPE